LTYQLVRAAQHRRTVRSRFFGAIAPKLAQLRRTITPSGFERISGQFNGAEIDLQIMVDSLTYRKLPCFWLLASQIETANTPLLLSQKISLMMRPIGFETFSIAPYLPYQTSHLPAPFPDDICLRSEKPLEAKDLAFLRRHAAIFKDQRVKELFFSPQGCRLSWLLQEAARGRYLIFREAELNRAPLTWEELIPLLEILQNLRHDLVRQAATEEER